MATMISYTKEEFQDFDKWLGLNYEALTWQGRYEIEFNTFWQAFFVAGQSLKQVAQRFEYALFHAQIGPLHSWFNWLRKSFLCYTFINRKVDILTLSESSNISYDNLALILREFFIDHYPEHEDKISEYFQISNVVSSHLYLTFEQLKEELALDDRALSSNTESVLGSMEVTLYPEWNNLNKKIQKDFLHPNINFSRIKSNISFSRQLSVFKEVLILLLIGLVLVFVVKKANEKWEKSILEQISIYEPQLKWLDKTLSFKEDEATVPGEFDLGAKELDEVESKESQFDNLTFDDNTRYDVESDVTLTSWDSLPKDFDVVSLEQSEYEELGKRGYRDSRYGNTKVYRVLMRSVDTSSTKDRLNALIKKYNVTRVDNVKPGKGVPGGIYYNIYVPREYLKEFLAQASSFDQAVLYESRTRTGRNPPGKNKVFIWVKNI